MSTPARRSLAVAFLLLLVPVLGACGFSYQTDQVYQPAVGVNDRDGAVDVLSAVVVSGVDEEGTLVASLVNESEEDDTLVEVTPADAEAGLTTRVVEPVEIPAGELVNLADLGAVSVTGSDIFPGEFARLLLRFESGQETELNIPVVAQSDVYSEVSPADPSPAASPTP